MYGMFMFILKLFNLSSLGNEKVWVNPLLLGYGRSQYLPIGSQVFDSSGRLCTVHKQGTIGALKRMSIRNTRATTIGKALKMGMSLKFRLLTLKYKAIIAMFRSKMALKRLPRTICQHVVHYLDVYLFFLSCGSLLLAGLLLTFVKVVG